MPFGFKCACCGKFKPVQGRKNYKKTGKFDALNRPKYTYICTDCQEEAKP